MQIQWHNCQVESKLIKSTFDEVSTGAQPNGFDLDQGQSQNTIIYFQKRSMSLTIFTTLPRNLPSARSGPSRILDRRTLQLEREKLFHYTKKANFITLKYVSRTYF